MTNAELLALFERLIVQRTSMVSPRPEPLATIKKVRDEILSRMQEAI